MTHVIQVRTLWGCRKNEETPELMQAYRDALVAYSPTKSGVALIRAINEAGL